MAKATKQEAMQCPICEVLGDDNPVIVKSCKMSPGKPPMRHWGKCARGDNGFMTESHFKELDRAGKIFLLDSETADV